MKHLRMLLVGAMAFLLFSGPATAATVVSDAQIAEIATLAQAGGDVTQAVEAMMAGITENLIAQGLTEDELQAQIAVATQEMTSGLDTGVSNFETVVNQIANGATAGAVQGVNRAVGANPNLNPATLTSSVTQGAARGVTNIAAANPGLNAGNLQASVNSGAQRMGATPVAPEAFEPATPPAAPPAPQAPVTPPPPPAVGNTPAVETPPTQDTQAASPT